MHIIIFSRDRALQLDATLNSLSLNCLDLETSKITIIYKATSQLHREQYTILEKEYKSISDVTFVEEQSFRRDLLQSIICHQMHEHTVLSRVLPKCNGVPIWLIQPILNKLLRPLFLFFIVDDTVFTLQFSLNIIKQIFSEHPKAIGFSLRLGKNTIYCYPKNKKQELPEFTEISDSVIKFNWINADLDFGYPLEISSSIYKSSLLLPMLITKKYNNPNELEWRLAKSTKNFQRRYPELLCFGISAAFSNPINRVQQATTNRSGTKSYYSEEKLAELFNQGYRINVGEYSGVISNGAHQEVDLKLTKR